MNTAEKLPVEVLDMISEKSVELDTISAANDRDISSNDDSSYRGSYMISYQISYMIS